MGLTSALLLFVMQVATASLADDAEFAQVQELYVDLECEKALKLLHAIQAKESWQPSELAQLSMWQGLCHAQLSQNDARDAAIDHAVRLDPSLQLPSFTPPKVVEIFAATREKLSGAKEKAHATSEVAASAASPGAAQMAAEGVLGGEPASALPTSEASGVGWLVSGAMVLGGAALLGGVVSAGLALPNALGASDPDAFQDDAIALAQLANQQLALSGGLLVTGACLLGGGIFVEHATAD